MTKQGLEHVQGWERRVLLDIPVGTALLGATAVAAVPLSIMASRATRSTPLFRQERDWGPDRTVNVWKFRTIPPEQGGALQLHGTRDPRTTPIARRLRETGLDELPQSLNVVGGSMSAVGPRPLLTETLDMMSGHSLFDEWYLMYRSIRTGVFGPSQLYRRGHAADVSKSAMGDSMAVDLRYFTEQATLGRDWEIVRRSGLYLTHMSSAQPDEIVLGLLGWEQFPPPQTPPPAAPEG
jgi:lipopolysaccharide/colanic/teichoic acid biosynthesis glycosyltransferase